MEWALARQRGNSCLSQLFTTQEQNAGLLLPGSSKRLECAHRRALQAAVSNLRNPGKC